MNGRGLRDTGCLSFVGPQAVAAAGVVRSMSKVAQFTVPVVAAAAARRQASNVNKRPGRQPVAMAAGLTKRNDFDAYRSRIEYLRSEAAHDGYALNSDSETDFQQFVLATSGIRKGNLVLMDNGNLRAVWRDKQGNHLGLQFLGGGMVQYVIFKRRLAAKLISRGTGRDTFAGLKQQINAFDLNSMLYE